MNKKIWLIVVLAFLAVAIIGMMTLLILKVPININSEKKVILRQEFREDEISKINIDAESSDILVTTHDKDYFEVEVYGNEKDRVLATVDNYNLKVSHHGNTLCFGLCFGEKKIVVRVPKSASVEADISTASGDVEIPIYMNDMKIATASGDIKVGEAADVDLLSVSGDVKVRKVDKAVIKTTSGEIEVDAVSSVLEMKSVSGDIEVNHANLILDSSIQTTSGDVFVNVINNVYVNTKTTSGDVYVESNDRYAKTTLKVSTTSGDIKVNH